MRAECICCETALENVIVSLRLLCNFRMTTIAKKRRRNLSGQIFRYGVVVSGSKSVKRYTRGHSDRCSSADSFPSDLSLGGRGEVSVLFWPQTTVRKSTFMRAQRPRCNSVSVLWLWRLTAFMGALLYVFFTQNTSFHIKFRHSATQFFIRYICFIIRGCVSAAHVQVKSDTIRVEKIRMRNK